MLASYCEEWLEVASLYHDKLIEFETIGRYGNAWFSDFRPLPPCNATVTTGMIVEISASAMAHQWNARFCSNCYKYLMCVQIYDNVVNKWLELSYWKQCKSHCICSKNTLPPSHNGTVTHFTNPFNHPHPILCYRNDIWSLCGKSFASAEHSTWQSAIFAKNFKQKQQTQHFNVKLVETSHENALGSKSKAIVKKVAQTDQVS